MTGGLRAFPPLEIDGVRVVIDQVRPVAVLQRPGAPDQAVTWPDLFTGWAAPHVAVVEAPQAVWVHYGLRNSVGPDDPLAAAVDDVDAPVVHVDSVTGAASVVRIGRDQVLGATRHGLWTTDQRGLDPDHEHPYLGGPLPPDWHLDTRVTVHRADGTRQPVTVDRPVLAVDTADRHVRLLVLASPPVAVPSGDGSTTYRYRSTELLLPDGLALPERIVFRDLVPEGWGAPAGPARPQSASMIAAATECTPGAETDWTVVELPPDLQQHAVAHIVRQFADLEHYWHPQNGSPAHPLSDGLHDVAVTVHCDHPHTEVEVSFRHPAYPEGRLRRTYRVYDSAGRMHIDGSLAIWLMEDLDTRDLPPVHDAVDGILNI